MAGGPDYILDLGGRSGVSDQHADGSEAPLRGRPWLSVHWRCCGVYTRIYRNRSGTAYVGYCPKCGQSARARVAPGGTTARFFEAG